MKKIELLAPAGSLSKLKVALLYGADAVYCGGRNFGLRAYADNFSFEELIEAVSLAHSSGKKVYVTVNIYAEEDDLKQLPFYAKELEQIGVDGVIVSDMGVFSIFSEYAPSLELHVSTQANVTNSKAALMWKKLGAKRIILARETRLKDIPAIKDAVGDTEIEAFVHGAMCISYSGRCLLSSFFTSRSGNKGECTQCCRWEYDLIEKKRGEAVTMEEDVRGTYILSSKDLRMIDHLKELIDAGVSSFKIEGRVKSEYYVASVVNAYRRALSLATSGKPFEQYLLTETEKISNRGYTTGFFYDENGGSTGANTQVASSTYIADVMGEEDGFAKIRMRNRFAVGDELEVLSPSDSFNKTIKVEEMYAASTRQKVEVADKVMQELLIKTDVKLSLGDYLRRNN